MSNKKCVNCGCNMKQLFIGLQHCSCGISWMKNLGYFERTDNMVFALGRKTIQGKMKHVPVIKYRSNT